MAAIDERRRGRSLVTKARRIGALLLAAGAGVSLAACSGEPGAAAVVDGRAIPSSEVREVQQEIGEYLRDASTPSVISAMVQEQAVIDFAAAKGVGASEADGDKLLESASSKPGDTFSDASRVFAQYSVAYSNIAGLQDDAVTAELDKVLDGVQVEVNPRFGSGTDANAVTAPAPLPWIVAAT
jgi:hypothetical protein